MGILSARIIDPNPNSYLAWIRAVRTSLDIADCGSIRRLSVALSKWHVGILAFNFSELTRKELLCLLAILDNRLTMDHLESIRSIGKKQAENMSRRVRKATDRNPPGSYFGSPWLWAPVVDLSKLVPDQVQASVEGNHFQGDDIVSISASSNSVCDSSSGAGPSSSSAPEGKACLTFEDGCSVLENAASTGGLVFVRGGDGRCAWLSRYRIDHNGSLQLELQLKVKQDCSWQITVPRCPLSSLRSGQVMGDVESWNKEVQWFLSAKMCPGLNSKHALLQAHVHTDEMKVLVPGLEADIVHYHGAGANLGCSIAYEALDKKRKRSAYDSDAFTICPNCNYFLECLVRRKKNADVKARTANTKSLFSKPTMPQLRNHSKKSQEDIRKRANSSQKRHRATRRILKRRTEQVEELLVKVDAVTCEKMLEASKVIERDMSTGGQLEEYLAGDTTGTLRADFEQSIKALRRQKEGPDAARGMRFSHNFLSTMVQLYAACPKALAILRESSLIGVPSDKTLAAIIRASKATDGFTKEAHERMQDNAEVYRLYSNWWFEEYGYRPSGRMVFVCDELVIKGNLALNSKSELLCGWPVAGGQLSAMDRVYEDIRRGSPPLARHVMGCIARDFECDLDLIGPIVSSEKGLDAGFIYDFVLNSIELFNDIGLSVDLVVFDGAAYNLLCVKMFCDFTYHAGGHDLQRCDPGCRNPFTGRWLVFLFDFPHLFKSGRNAGDSSRMSGNPRHFLISSSTVEPRFDALVTYFPKRMRRNMTAKVERELELAATEAEIAYLEACHREEKKTPSSLTLGVELQKRCVEMRSAALERKKTNRQRRSHERVTNAGLDTFGLPQLGVPVLVAAPVSDDGSFIVNFGWYLLWELWKWDIGRHGQKYRPSRKYLNKRTLLLTSFSKMTVGLACQITHPAVLISFVVFIEELEAALGDRPAGPDIDQGVSAWILKRNRIVSCKAMTLYLQSLRFMYVDFAMARYGLRSEFDEPVLALLRGFSFFKAWHEDWSRMVFETKTARNKGFLSYMTWRNMKVSFIGALKMIRLCFTAFPNTPLWIRRWSQSVLESLFGELRSYSRGTACITFAQVTDRLGTVTHKRRAKMFKRIGHIPKKGDRLVLKRAAPRNADRIGKHAKTAKVTRAIFKKLVDDRSADAPPAAATPAVNLAPVSPAPVILVSEGPVRQLVFYDLIYGRLRMIFLKVWGDGSCWIYSFLTVFGLCEHACSEEVPPDARPEPTTRDKQWCAILREKVFEWIDTSKLLLQLDAYDLEHLHEVRNASGFGDTHHLQALCVLFKVDCVIHFRSALREPSTRHILLQQ